MFLFYLPIVWIGFDPVWVIRHGLSQPDLPVLRSHRTSQRIGWPEWIINTPSAHRVHHASNAEYIDKNFGGVLMIWDRLLGTYQAELPNIKIRYGLAHPRSSPANPFVIAYEDFWRLLKEVVSARGWQAWPPA